MTTKATENVARFPTGRTLVTPGALDALDEAGQTPAEFLRRTSVAIGAS